MSFGTAARTVAPRGGSEISRLALGTDTIARGAATVAELGPRFRKGSETKTFEGGVRMNIRRSDGKLVYRAEPYRNYYGDLVTPADVVLAEGDGGISPRKEASENCKSGKRDYCTCDVCF